MLRRVRLLGFPTLSVTPILLLLLVFSVYPLLQLLAMSFADVSFRGGEQIWSWVGIRHYVQLTQDSGYWISLRNTFVYAATTVSVELLLGFTLAFASTRIRRGAALYRTVLMLPLLVPPIAIGTAWRLLYNANFGLINQALTGLGLPAQYWLSQPETALFAVVAVSIWHWTAYVFILLLAGLQNIPEQLYESARIDGAAGWQLLRYVTLPLLVPTILVTIVFRTINAFKVFDLVYALTGGGPGLSSEVINTYVYKVFINQQQFGYGAALATLGLIIVGGLALLFNRLFSVRGGVA